MESLCFLAGFWRGQQIKNWDCNQDSNGERGKSVKVIYVVGSPTV